MPTKKKPSKRVPNMEMRNIWKRFPGVIANKGTDFCTFPGEVHALLGENGAGKTTLMKILSGLYRADFGEIFIDGENVDISSPKDALRYRIGLVHQHFRLVRSMTVAENIHMGWEKTPRIVTKRTLAERVKNISSNMQFDCDPTKRIEELSVGEQQKVEILKILARGVDILILDEPTAVLTPSEAEELFLTLRAMAENGKSIIFISHKLEEVLSVSDRITVLRHGKNIGTLPTSICSVRALARLMVGQHVSQEEFDKKGIPGRHILELQNVSVKDDRGLPLLIDINLQIKEREIMGIAGVSGNGQVELARVIAGQLRRNSGEITLKSEFNERESLESEGDISEAGLGYIPEDRLSTGLLPSLPVMHNAILREYSQPPISKGIRFLKDGAAIISNQIVLEGDVRVPNIGVLLHKLSGGNQQKLLAQREMRIAKNVLIAAQPTRGLDVSATDAVRRKLVEHRNNGVAVLLISEDLDEIFQLSDRIAVMYGGELFGPFEKSKVSRDEIGLLMGGSGLRNPEI